MSGGGSGEPTRPDAGDEAQAQAPRHVDPADGTLAGIGAQQQVSGEPSGYPPPDETEHRRPDQAVPAASPTYYDQPVIKEPVWIWSVPAYLYTGGVTAGASLLGAVAQVTDRDGHARLIEQCRWLSLAGAVCSTGFLIHDLGRPARFLNMLRVFRPSSAMSVGSWTLAGMGTATGAAAVLPRLGLRRLGDAAGLVAGALGPPLGTYTAVLLSDTAVPVWQATRRTSPALFGASGLVGATSALELLPQPEREQRLLARLGTAAKVAELAAGEALEHDADEVERVGRPLHEGAGGALWRTAKASVAASLGVSLLPVPDRWHPLRRRVAAILGTIGSITTRFALFHAGKVSARAPRSTFEAQRAGRGGAEATGTPAVTGPEGDGAG